MSRISQKRIMSEINMYKKENFMFPNLILRYNSDNLLQWYFVIYDLKDTPYENGFYFGKIVLPHDYPFKAPDFIFLTPNGRFKTDIKICTSFSAFHPESFTSAWNILTMMEGLISFMTDEVDSNETNGIGSIYTDIETRQNLANESMNWNKNNELFVSIFGNEWNNDIV